MGNKVIGKVGPKLGIYEESNDAQLSASLGQERVMEDGRKFRLCKAGEVLAAGYIVQAVANLSASASLNVAASAGIGDKEVVVDAVTNAEYAVHALKDGYLVGEAIAGDIGQFYKIKDNTVMTNGSEATITLYDGLTNAFVVDSTRVTVCANPYLDVVIDANTAPIVGVPLIAVTSGYYFWALCSGMGPGIDSGSAITAGNYVEHAAGEVLTYAGVAENPCGIAVTALGANDGGIIKYFDMG